jgi:hypothetical protein
VPGRISSPTNGPLAKPATRRSAQDARPNFWPKAGAHCVEAGRRHGPARLGLRARRVRGTTTNARRRLSPPACMPSWCWCGAARSVCASQHGPASACRMPASRGSAGGVRIKLCLLPACLPACLPSGRLLQRAVYVHSYPAASDKRQPNTSRILVLLYHGHQRQFQNGKKRCIRKHYLVDFDPQLPRLQFIPRQFLALPRPKALAISAPQSCTDHTGAGNLHDCNNSGRTARRRPATNAGRVALLCRHLPLLRATADIQSPTKRIAARI